MAKLGFEIPTEIEVRLRRYVAWGNKGKIIEGLLLVMVERLEAGDEDLYKQALMAYWEAHR